VSKTPAKKHTIKLIPDHNSELREKASGIKTNIFKDHLKLGHEMLK
jgi:hypothetical protein